MCFERNSTGVPSFVRSWIAWRDDSRSAPWSSCGGCTTRGALGGDAYWAAYEEELERLRGLPGGSGGNFYLTLGARASKRFARALVISTLEGQSSFTEAFRLLGFKKMATFRELGHSLGIGF